MIQYKDKIFPEYFIDPITAVITNSKGEIQKTCIHKDGYAYFKNLYIHQIQIHTHIGYKKGYDIHHIDENKLNNSLSNLIYLTHSEHNIIHKKGNKNMFGKHHSEDAKRKMSESLKGENHPLFGKHHSNETLRKMSEAQKGRTLSEETKRKISESLKGRSSGENNPCYGTKFKWINDGIQNRRCQLDEDIPEGFVCGMLKKYK